MQKGLDFPISPLNNIRLASERSGESLGKLRWSILEYNETILSIYICKGHPRCVPAGGCPICNPKPKNGTKNEVETFFEYI